MKPGVRGDWEVGIGNTVSFKNGSLYFGQQQQQQSRLTEIAIFVTSETHVFYFDEAGRFLYMGYKNPKDSLVLLNAMSSTPFSDD